MYSSSITHYSINFVFMSSLQVKTRHSRPQTARTVSCSPSPATSRGGQELRWAQRRRTAGSASGPTVIPVLVSASSSSTTLRIGSDWIRIKLASWGQTHMGTLLGWTACRACSIRDQRPTCTRQGSRDRAWGGWWRTSTWAGALPTNRWRPDSGWGGCLILYRLRVRSWTCQTIRTSRDTWGLPTRWPQTLGCSLITPR